MLTSTCMLARSTAERFTSVEMRIGPLTRTGQRYTPSSRAIEASTFSTFARRRRHNNGKSQLLKPIERVNQSRQNPKEIMTEGRDWRSKDCRLRGPRPEIAACKSSPDRKPNQ